MSFRFCSSLLPPLPSEEEDRREERPFRGDLPDFLWSCCGRRIWMALRRTDLASTDRGYFDTRMLLHLMQSPSSRAPRTAHTMATTEWSTKSKNPAATAPSHSRRKSDGNCREKRSLVQLVAKVAGTMPRDWRCSYRAGSCGCKMFSQRCLTLLAAGLRRASQGSSKSLGELKEIAM